MGLNRRQLAFVIGASIVAFVLLAICTKAGLTYYRKRKLREKEAQRHRQRAEALKAARVRSSRAPDAEDPTLPPLLLESPNAASINPLSSLSDPDASSLLLPKGTFPDPMQHVGDAGDEAPTPLAPDGRVWEGTAYEPSELHDFLSGSEVDVESLSLKAAEGDAKAAAQLAVVFYHGITVDRDLEEALIWLQRSAELGDPDAQLILSRCLRQAGQEAEADTWCEIAASNGQPDAQNSFGMRLEREGNVEAGEWYRRAAEQDLPVAQFNLGGWLHAGLGGSVDQVGAAMWFERAAMAGMSQAQNFLGMCYMQGHGKIKNDQEAVKWWTRAAEAGDGKAAYNLALCYLNGTGVEANPEEARQWFKEASARGNEQAAHRLRDVEGS